MSEVIVCFEMGTSLYRQIERAARIWRKIDRRSRNAFPLEFLQIPLLSLSQVGFPSFPTKETQSKVIEVIRRKVKEPAVSRQRPLHLIESSTTPTYPDRNQWSQYAAPIR